MAGLLAHGSLPAADLPRFPQWSSIAVSSPLTRTLHQNVAAGEWSAVAASFDDGLELLKAANRMRLEGIVSKRREAPYRSGNQCDWIKVL